MAAGRRRIADAGGATGSATCYGDEPEGVWFAPGRVNLVGEHTDYNEGFVLPFALGQGVAAAAAPRDDDVLALRTRRDPAASVEIPLELLRPRSRRRTAGGVSGTGFPAGPGTRPESPGRCVAAGHPVRGRQPGHRLVPGRRGRAVVVRRPGMLGRSGADRTGWRGRSRPCPGGSWRAIARRAENEFVGVPSGIMDQSAALLCLADHALLLDCQSLESSQVPFDPAAAGARVLVIDTRAKHELTDGEYGGRQTECHEAARRLGVPSLRCGHRRQRAGRAGRPGAAAPGPPRDHGQPARSRRWPRCCAPPAAATPRALAEVGALLTQSHASLRDDFEVSWPEADVAVDAAVAAGALGARMTGGGFGGSAIALVPDADAGQVEARIRAAYADRGWTEPEFMTAVPSDAAQRML